MSMKRVISRKGAKKRKTEGAKKTIDRLFAPLVFLFFAPLRETVFLPDSQSESDLISYYGIFRWLAGIITVDCEA
jgi:hypothetical protein